MSVCNVLQTQGFMQDFFLCGEIIARGTQKNFEIYNLLQWKFLLGGGGGKRAGEPPLSLLPPQNKSL